MPLIDENGEPQSIAQSNVRLRELLYLIHPLIAERIFDIRALALEGIMNTDGLSLLDNFVRRREILTAGLVTRLSEGVYRFPFLAKETCAELIRFQGTINYAPNTSESAEYQMDEYIISNEAPQLDSLMRFFNDEILVPMWVILEGIYPSDVNSIQLARYRPQVRSSTGWHYDESSDCTTVVELSDNARETGSSFKVFPDIDLGLAENAGEATIFKGRTTFHRSLPVERGERVILVFWANNEFR